MKAAAQRLTLIAVIAWAVICGVWGAIHLPELLAPR